MGLVTNIGEYAIVKALKLFDLQEFFDVLITRNHVKFLKPNPEGLNLAMEKLDTTPRQVIFVGDSVNDIEAAELHTYIVQLLSNRLAKSNATIKALMR